MKKVYVGIDAHKDENVFGSAVEGRGKEELIGKCSADLNRTITFIRKFQKKHELAKEQLHICYEAGPTGFVLARRINFGRSKRLVPRRAPNAGWI